MKWQGCFYRYLTSKMLQESNTGFDLCLSTAFMVFLIATYLCGASFSKLKTSFINVSLKFKNVNI